MTINEANELVASEVSWNACVDIRYKYAVYESEDGWIQQRRVLYYFLNNKTGLMQSE